MPTPLVLDSMRTHRRRLRAIALVSVGALGVTLAISAANDIATGSTPNSGILTTTSGAKTWTGGPFVAPNPTGNVGDPDCTAPNSCDDYSLTVSTPAGTGDTQNLKISVKWDNTAADFDVYVLDQAGAIVASSASSSDPETIVMPPTSGVYTVRVVPFLPLGSSYTATAALVTKPNDGAPGSTAPAPTFTDYGVPQAFTDSHNAGEPSIGYSDPTGSSYYQSSLSTYKVRFDDTVSPAKATWTDVSASATNGCPQGSTTSLDPILYTDRTTGRTFESQLSGVDSLTCYTDDEGVTWHPSQGGGIPSGVDHQTLGGGNFVASDPLNATNTYSRAVYYCSQDIATAFCALSRNGGLTFGAGVPAYSLLDCGGLHGHLQVAPDGTAYLPNKSCDGHQAVVSSADDGQTWTVNTVPNSLPSDSDPAVGIGSNGTVFFGYANGDGTPHVAVSHDKGQTWTNDFNVGSALGIKNTVFPTMIAGDDNRAALSFIGTTTGGNYQDAANFKGVWYVYTAFTYDGGKTWTTVNDTPNDPVQRGSICTAGTTCGNDRNLLDFIGSTIDGTGRVEVAFADGCTGACVTGTTNNFDAYATIARQSSGLSLFSAYDPLPNLVITNVSTHIVKSGGSSVSATMSNVGKAGGTAPVRFLVDGTALTTTGAKTVAPNKSVTVTAAWNTKGLKGSHTITAVADPNNVVKESDEGDNRGATTVRLG
jgi:CARDB